MNFFHPLKDEIVWDSRDLQIHSYFCPVTKQRKKDKQVHSISFTTLDGKEYVTRFVNEPFSELHIDYYNLDKNSFPPALMDAIKDEQCWENFLPPTEENPPPIKPGSAIQVLSNTFFICMDEFFKYCPNAKCVYFMIDKSDTSRHELFDKIHAKYVNHIIQLPEYNFHPGFTSEGSFKKRIGGEKCDVKFYFLIKR